VDAGHGVVPRGTVPVDHDGHPLDRGRLDGVERGLEEGLLAAEVVVERALGDAGPLDDRVERSGRVAPFREQLQRRVDQRLPGGLGVVDAS
jgi:hypothetical protein